MNVAEDVRTFIREVPAGRIFSYHELPHYGHSPAAVVKAVNRLIAKRKICRLSRGKFYVPQRGDNGPRAVNVNEFIRAQLYQNGRINGYITGPALYNQLGLTLDTTDTITIASNAPRPPRHYQQIQIQFVSTQAPVNTHTVRILQYLDCLRDIDNIPGADNQKSLRLLLGYISSLAPDDIEYLSDLAESYYNGMTRSLVALLYETLGYPVSDSLLESIVSGSRYRLGINALKWPLARKWNIY